AVVDCLARNHDLVVLDTGRTLARAATPFQRQLIMTGLTVRAVAATRVALPKESALSTGLVVRRGGPISAKDVARATDLPLIGVVPNLGDLAGLADRGQPPSLGGSWRRACHQILDWCLSAGS
ncbi:MAG: hypothetical protein LBE83_01165, partial [Propionibacteriaceae bacterium]|nr:hypothetical protein [Propionibacteriaceae bacterium]